MKLPASSIRAAWALNADISTGVFLCAAVDTVVLPPVACIEISLHYGYAFKWTLLHPVPKTPWGSECQGLEHWSLIGLGLWFFLWHNLKWIHVKRGFFLWLSKGVRSGWECTGWDRCFKWRLPSLCKGFWTVVNTKVSVTTQAQLIRPYMRLVTDVELPSVPFAFHNTGRGRKMRGWSVAMSSMTEGVLCQEHCRFTGPRVGLSPSSSFLRCTDTEPGGFKLIIYELIN